MDVLILSACFGGVHALYMSIFVLCFHFTKINMDESELSYSFSKCPTVMQLIFVTSTVKPCPFIFSDEEGQREYLYLEIFTTSLLIVYAEGQHTNLVT